MNVEGMIKRLKGQSYTITRAAADGTYSPTTGDFTPGTTTTLPIWGSVQPLGQEDLLQIPEGDRTRERFRFFSFPPLLNQQTARLRKGDLVDLSGVSYRVEKVAHWPGYSKAIIVRVNSDVN